MNHWLPISFIIILLYSSLKFVFLIFKLTCIYSLISEIKFNSALQLSGKVTGPKKIGLTLAKVSLI